jgi:uncharacterized protein (UPF0332 family)
MFYAALALLQTIGQAPSKHTGVISLFDAGFYHKGSFPKEMSRTLRELFELRQFSEYNSFQPISADQASDALGKGEVSLSAVQAYLEQHGYFRST